MILSMLQTFYVLTCNKDLTFVIRKMFWCFIKRNETAIMIRYVQWWQFQALRKIFWMVIKFAVSYTKFMQYKQSVIIYRACKFVCWSLIMNCFFCVNFRFCSTSKQWQYPPLQTTLCVGILFHILYICYINLTIKSTN